MSEGTRVYRSNGTGTEGTVEGVHTSWDGSEMVAVVWDDNPTGAAILHPASSLIDF